MLEDLSTNGTFVNGVKIGKGSRAVLATGDVVSFCPLNGDGEDIRYVFHATPAGYVAALPDPEAAGGLYMCYEYAAISAHPADRRSVREEIGKGSFATVKRAISRADGSWAAIKIINKARFTNQPKTFRMLEREVEILKSIQHAHIIGFLDYFEDDQYMYIVRWQQMDACVCDVWSRLLSVF